MHRVILLAAMLFATLLSAQTTATINMQQAVASSQEGMKRSAIMRAKWAGPLAAIEKREAEIKTERETLDRDSKRRHGVWPFRHVMNAKEKAALSHEIDLKAKAVALQRERDRGDFEAERRRIVGQIASRMTPIIQTYAKDHGYSLVLDSGQQDGPVIVTSNDITGQIVSLFDHAFPRN